MRRLVRRRGSGRLSLIAAITLLATCLPAAALAVGPRGEGDMTASRSEMRSGHRGSVDLAALPHASIDQTASDPTLGRPTVEGPAQPNDTTSAPVPRQTTSAPPLDDDTWYVSNGVVTPADPSVAVGPEHVLIGLHQGYVRVADRDADHHGELWDVSAADLFDLPEGFLHGGVRVAYEPAHARWLITEWSVTCDDDGNGIEDDPVGYLDMLVSNTSDPFDGFQLYYFGWDGLVPTQVAVGSSSDKLALASNLNELTGPDTCWESTAHEEANFLIMDWADVLSSLAPGGDLDIANEALSFADDGDFTVYADPRVPMSVPATTTRLHVLAQHSIDGGTFYHLLKLDGSVVAGTLTAGYDADLSFLGPPTDAPAPLQPGGSTVGSTIPSRPHQVVWQAERLTWVSTHGCIPAGSATMRACLRVTQIGTAGALGDFPSSRQDFLIGENGADHYVGGIALALDGTLHVGWTRSADAVGGQPSTYVAYQRPTDGPNRLSPIQALIPGAGGPMTVDTWSEDMGLAPDPQVPDAVWMASAVANGGNEWIAYGSQLQTGGATYVPIAPVRVLDSRIGLGVPSSFVSSKPRTFPVAGFSSGAGSIPSGAIAITGNLTVTGQGAGGYVSVTTTATATPTSSTLNVPFGDTRANNLTVPLSATGKLSAVFKSGAGKTAQLILDVTGYFLPGPEDAGYTPLPPTRFLDSRSGISKGLSGRFVTNIPRKLDVAGHDGVPADAVAITANVTVVNQTKSGYVSVTPTSQPSPTSSTINVPVGDVRANGLTARLQGGDLWLVYKAGAGATTDLILDVTGYYLPAGSGMAFHALDPGRLMDTRSTHLSGLTGTFKSGTPRKLLTDGHWGVPVGAKAITGNLTVVGQTGAGYVSATPTSQPNPTTSTINVPLGDVRANGITVPLDVNGDQWFVYKAGTGKTTNLILDVTGYFE